jgi:hypothetical protein
MAKLSVELNRYFFQEDRPETVTLSDILTLAGERTFGFLLVILSLPSALPIPAPGYSIPFGILIFLLAIQLIGGSKIPWLPKKMMNGSMKTETARKFVKMGLPWLGRIEAITKPRLSYICTSIPGRLIIGIAIALMAISMMIPIPGTNTAPAMGIFITSFGLQEDDGFITLVGLTVCLLAGIVSTSIIIAFIWGGSSIIDLIKEQLN